MWIKRSEWDRLKERIDRLEKRDAEITTVVRAICDHLGLKINRIEATPERIVLEKAKK